MRNLGQSYIVALMAGLAVFAFASEATRDQAVLWCRAAVFALVALTAWRVGQIAQGSAAQRSDDALAATSTVEARSETVGGWLARVEEASHGLARLLLFAGAAMGAGYLLTALDWYHAYQYALLFLLIAAATYAFARYVAGRGRLPGGRVALASLASAQVLGAGVGLAFLHTSGKLALVRADWLANAIFEATAGGAIALGCIALFVVVRARTQ